MDVLFALRRGPRAVAVQRERHVHVVTQRARNGLPALLAPQQRLPRVHVLRFVEVAVRYIGVVLQARDREQIVAVRRFPDVDQFYEPLAVIP